MAWKIYLAEIAEEGIDLVEPNKAHELVERCFDLAKNFLIVRARLTAKPPKEDKSRNEEESKGPQASDQSEAEGDDNQSEEPRAEDQPAADETGKDDGVEAKQPELDTPAPEAETSGDDSSAGDRSEEDD